MSDQRVQELLRELRDRWGVRVGPLPPPDLVEHLVAEARSDLRHGGSSLGPTGARMVLWLQSCGVRVACDAYVGGGRERRSPRCMLDLGHDGKHRNRQRWELDQDEHDACDSAVLAAVRDEADGGPIVTPAACRRIRRQAELDFYAAKNPWVRDGLVDAGLVVDRPCVVRVPAPGLTLTNPPRRRRRRRGNPA